MNPLKKIGFLFGYTLPFVMVTSFYWGGPNWAFSAVVYSYIFIPILDEIIGKDKTNVLKMEFEELVQDIYFDILVYSNVYIQFGLLFWASWLITTQHLTAFQFLGLTASIGVFSSGIINIAHELGHRQSKIAQFHSKMALMSVCYMHFFIEHNRGHHVHVATPQDPASSRKGQTVFDFWRQTLIGSYRSAWQIEAKRLAREGKSILSINNDMIWFAILPLCLLSALLAIPLFHNSIFIPHYLYLITLFFVLQSLIAILSLECVNYIEHYGIERRLINGKYERVNPLHSWNANHLMSNLLLFQLQRHSDHHAFASRPYQVLRHFDESPQLPFGYPVMILMSLFPVLWFRVMDKRLESWKRSAYDAEHITQVVKQFA